MIRETSLYNRIGLGYSEHRRPDPRIASLLLTEIGDTQRVLNVGAGTGSYEPTDRSVVAAEPSITMIRQRHISAAPVVQASATRLPFTDDSFDTTLAILTLHHWQDWRRGLAELARGSKQRIVVLTWDPAEDGFWLVKDYFPDILETDRRSFPSIEDIESILGNITLRPVPIPHDCTDGFMGAYWRRPEAYLHPDVRSAISSFSKVQDIEPRLASLREDLDSGRWDDQYGHLRQLEQLDLGYRLITKVMDKSEYIA